LTLRPRLGRTDQFGADGKREFVRQAIDALVAEGHLTERDGPRGARLLMFLKPYREADDHAP
jgi:hypothetical protein